MNLRTSKRSTGKYQNVFQEDDFSDFFHFNSLRIYGNKTTSFQDKTQNEVAKKGGRIYLSTFSKILNNSPFMSFISVFISATSIFISSTSVCISATFVCNLATSVCISATFVCN